MVIIEAYGSYPSASLEQFKDLRNSIGQRLEGMSYKQRGEEMFVFLLNPIS